jgi:hypothetical protein
MYFWHAINSIVLPHGEDSNIASLSAWPSYTFPMYLLDLMKLAIIFFNIVNVIVCDVNAKIGLTLLRGLMS